MSDFVHYDLGTLDAGSVVEVTLKNRANVLLVDRHNFNRHRRGERYSYFGGEALRSPIELRVPSTDHWHVVLDLGGGGGRIESSVRVLATH